MIDYAVNLDKKTSKRDFQEAFPETSPDLIALMESLLLVNPYYRFSATESIKSKIFDQCRGRAASKDRVAGAAARESTVE